MVDCPPDVKGWTTSKYRVDMLRKVRLPWSADTALPSSLPYSNAVSTVDMTY